MYVEGEPGRLGRWMVLALALVIVVAGVVFSICRTRPETAPGVVPEAGSPFGLVTRGNLAFQWLVPEDGAPVRVEVFDAKHASLWSSAPTRGGFLRPPASETARWPLDDLLWRPVAVPGVGLERPGDLAAFTLLP